jgi:hypothetical protein
LKRLNAAMLEFKNINFCMVKYFVAFCILFATFNSTIAIGQVQATDTVVVKKYTYYIGEKKISQKQILDLMQNCPEAYRLMKKSKNSNDINIILAAVAGYCIGWPVGQYIAGASPNWAIVSGTAVAAVVSIPFFIRAKKKSKKAVRVYNDYLIKLNK